MKRSVLFALRTESANVALAANCRFVNQARAKRERKATAIALLAIGARPSVPVVLAGINVTLTRIGVGTLDYPANLGPALKHVQDEVAAWLQLSDRDPRISWDFLQARCERGSTPGHPSYQGVRITVECSEPGADLDLVLGIGPKRIGPASHHGDGELPRAEHGADPKRRETRSKIARGISPPAPHRAPVEQPALTFRKCHALLPWDQCGDGLPELTELALDGAEPPSRITVKIPPLVRHLHSHAKNAILRLSARTVRLERHFVDHPELGGSAVIYAEPRAPELAFFAPKEVEVAQ